MVALAVVVYPVVVGANYLLTYPAFAPNGGDALEKLRDELGATGFDAPTVWTDWETKRLLPPYQRGFFGGDKVWTGPGRSLTGPGEPAPGDYVLLVQRPVRDLQPLPHRPAPVAGREPDGAGGLAARDDRPTPGTSSSTGCGSGAGA